MAQRQWWKAVLDGLSWGIGLGIGVPLGFALLNLGARLSGMNVIG